MLKRTVLALAVAALLLWLPACNYSEEEKAQFFVDRAAQKLQLSDAQKTKLFEVAMLALEFRTEMTKDEKEIKQELAHMFASERLDRARINDVLAEKEQVFRRYSRLLVSTVADFHSTLTTAQREQVIELLRKRD